MEVALNGTEYRTPDGEGTLEFEDFGAGKIYIAGNFTGGFKYNQAWSTDNEDIVANDNGVYTFGGVYLKQCDRFKLVDNGAWLGGSFTAVGTEFTIADGGSDIMLYTLATGLYDVIYDSVNHTLNIVAHTEQPVRTLVSITAELADTAKT